MVWFEFHLLHCKSNYSFFFILQMLKQNRLVEQFYNMDNFIFWFGIYRSLKITFFIIFSISLCGNRYSHIIWIVFSNELFFFLFHFKSIHFLLFIFRLWSIRNTFRSCLHPSFNFSLHFNPLLRKPLLHKVYWLVRTMFHEWSNHKFENRIDFLTQIFFVWRNLTHLNYFKIFKSK